MFYYTTKYLYGAYWTLATYTTTGYGDIRPRRFDEMLFTILVMIVAKMHVIYNMGILSSSQTNKQSLQVAFEEKLQVMIAIMCFKCFNPCHSQQTFKAILLFLYLFFFP